MTHRTADQPATKQDIQKILDILTVHNQRFESIERRLEEHQAYFIAIGDTIQNLIDHMDKRFASIDKRFEAIDKRFDHIDQRFEAMDRRFDDMDKRFDQLEETHSRRLDHHATEIDRIKAQTLTEPSKLRLQST